MSWEHAQRMARVREKEAHPERYCWHKRCLRERGSCREHPPADRESWIRGYAAALESRGGEASGPIEARETAEQTFAELLEQLEDTAEHDRIARKNYQPEPQG